MTKNGSGDRHSADCLECGLSCGGICQHEGQHSDSIQHHPDDHHCHFYVCKDHNGSDDCGKKGPSAFNKAVNAIRYSQIAVSLLTMQQSMLVAFGEAGGQFCSDPQCMYRCGRLLLHICTGNFHIQKQQKGNEIMAKSKIVQANSGFLRGN